MEASSRDDMVRNGVVREERLRIEGTHARNPRNKSSRFARRHKYLLDLPPAKSKSTRILSARSRENGAHNPTTKSRIWGICLLPTFTFEWGGLSKKGLDNPTPCVVGSQIQPPWWLVCRVISCSLVYFLFSRARRCISPTMSARATRSQQTSPLGTATNGKAPRKRNVATGPLRWLGPHTTALMEYMEDLYRNNIPFDATKAHTTLGKAIGTKEVKQVSAQALKLRSKGLALMTPLSADQTLALAGTKTQQAQDSRLLLLG